MEYPWCKQRITKVSLAEILRCFEHPISEEQAWAICFQCCCKMEQLAQGLYPLLHSVFIKGPGSIFIHADGTASFKVYPKSDVGSIQHSEDKLLECLGVVIYEALDWGIDSQAERELSDHLEKLLCLMLKLDNEAMKPAATLQDVIKICEEHLSRPSEATSYYKMTCGRLFTEYVELQKLVTIIQTSKESLRKMDMEDLVKNPRQKKEKNGASLWPSIIHELENGVRLRKATERSRRHVSPKESIRSPYELLLDDIQHKRYTLRKVIIKQNHSTLKDDVAAPKSHLKPVLERKLKECVPLESSWHEHLMTDIKQQQKLQSAAAKGNGSRPKEMLVMPNTVLKSPSNTFLTLQGETTPKLPSSTWLASTGPSVVSCISKGIPANGTCLSVSAPTLGDTKHNGFLDAGQQQLPPSRGRSKSLERVLQSKELNCHFSTKWPSLTIAELIGTRYTMMVLEGQGLFQGGAFPRAKLLLHSCTIPLLFAQEPFFELLFSGSCPKPLHDKNTGLQICFSCHKQMLLKWPYSCHLCSSVVCCDCCIKMSMPFRTCVHLPLHLLKLLRLSREEDPATQKQKSSELLHEIEHRERFGVPVILEPHCLAQSLCCYTGTMAGWLTADICRQCERYLLEMASSQRQHIPLRRSSWPRTKLE